jgi:hypothetical protein
MFPSCAPFFMDRHTMRAAEIAAHGVEKGAGNLPVSRSPSPERTVLAHANTPRSASSSSSSSNVRPVAAKNASSSVSTS